MRRLILFLWVFATACTPALRTPAATLAFTRLASTATTQPSPTTSPAPLPSPAATPGSMPAADKAALQGQIDSLLARYPAEWHILVKQVNGEVLYSRQAAQRIDAASVIKIPIALLFFKSLEPQNLPSLKDYLANKGIDGRTFGQLLHAMLVNSEEDATFSLLKALQDSHLNVHKTLLSWGAVNTDIVLRRSSVEDIAALIDGLYARDLLTPAAREIMLAYLAEYTSADDTRIGVIRSALPCGGQFYNKRGTIIKEYLAVADVAIIRFPSPAGERAYLIALFAYPRESGATYESLVQGMQTLAPAFWQAIRTENALPETVACNPPGGTPTPG